MKIKDIREYATSVNWDYLYLEYLDMNIDIIREFANKINWNQQYFDLRNMWDRWNLEDQIFFKEFKDYIRICTNTYGEFGQTTGITHEF